MVLGSSALKQLRPIDGLMGNVQPASWDITLGNTMLVEKRPTLLQRLVGYRCIAGTKEQWVDYPFGSHSKDNPYLLAPGELVLTCTQEPFNLPKDVAAELRIRSTAARSGLNNLLATWCDPGFHNSVLTLELQNANRWHYIAIYPGATFVGQMIFHRVESNDALYEGRYNNDRVTSAPKGAL